MHFIRDWSGFGVQGVCARGAYIVRLCRSAASIAGCHAGPLPLPSRSAWLGSVRKSESSGRSGRFRRLRQKNDPALSSFVEVNSYEGCLCNARSRDRKRVFQASHARKESRRRHYQGCHLNTLRFYRPCSIYAFPKTSRLFKSAQALVSVASLDKLSIWWSTGS